MTTVTLRADCTRCAALCCVALAFDRSELFGFDKPAGEPCRHLDACGRCRIHADLDSHGFRGCASYDCLGAGQHVTQEIFGGRSWRDDPSLLGPMMTAFKAMRAIRELLLILPRARALPLPAPARERLLALEARLERAAGSVTRDADGAAIDVLAEEARLFLRSLRPFAEQELTAAGGR